MITKSSLDRKRAVVTADKNEFLIDDLVLLIDVEEICEPKVWNEKVPLSCFSTSEQNNENEGMLVTFTYLPSILTQTVNQEVIILFEASKAMKKGERFQELQKAITSTIQQFPKHIHFQVISFSARHQAFFSSSVTATPRNILKASKDLRAIDADEEEHPNLLEPLSIVMKYPHIPNTSRTILSLSILFLLNCFIS